MKPLIAVVGATAAGKSAFAIRLAKALGKAVIINADAMQIYRQCPTLTAQPAATVKRLAPHRLYGVLDCRRPGCVELWAKMARREIAAARRKHVFPILVGGSGFYLQTLFYGLSAIPRPPPKVRAEARRLARNGGAGARLSPQTAAKTGPGDTQRLARALEVELATGKPLVAWQNRLGRRIEGRKLVIMLDPPLARLESRARLRLAKNAEKMAAEVRLTLQRQLSKEGDRANELPLVKACGFREFAACFADNLGENEGRKSLAEARQETLLSVRRYIRRQLTWFRHQRPKPNILLKNGQKAESARIAAMIRAGRI